MNNFCAPETKKLNQNLSSSLIGVSFFAFSNPYLVADSR